MGTLKRVHVVGPLVPHAAGFREHLIEQGYTPNSVHHQMLLMAHVSRWLAGYRLKAADLAVDTVERFLAARREAGYSRHLSSSGLSQLLGHLRAVAAAPLVTPSGPATPVEALVERYAGYLVRERGLASRSVVQYVRVARDFFASRSPKGDLDPAGVTAAEVTEFVLSACRGGTAVYAKRTASRLRALLRFLYVEGLTETALAAVVPSVSSRRLVSLTKAISAADVARLLRGCDRRTAMGRRDFAILTVLARLGLRAGEVASLRLADVDWRNGEVLVRGKGGRVARLPLPADVGEAIVGWLQRGRPRRDCPYVFTRVRAPLGPLSATGLSMVVDSACRTGWTADDSRSPSPAHRSDRDAACRRQPCGGCPGSSPSQPGHDLRLREPSGIAADGRETAGRLLRAGPEWVVWAVVSWALTWMFAR